MKHLGSRQIHKDNTNTDTMTSRRAWALTDNKHSLVFHKDGHLLIFYTKRKAVDYLKYNKCPEIWRPTRIQLEITHDRI